MRCDGENEEVSHHGLAGLQQFKLGFLTELNEHLSKSPLLLFIAIQTTKIAYD